MEKNSHEVGRNGEDLAATYLQRSGYTILERRYRSPRPAAEVDIICEPNAGRQGNRCVVFVEVKSRTSHRYGAPESAIDGRKRQRMLTAARAFLYENGLLDVGARFDVISVYFSPSGRGSLRHYRDAFGALELATQSPH